MVVVVVWVGRLNGVWIGSWTSLEIDEATIAIATMIYHLGDVCIRIVKRCFSDSMLWNSASISSYNDDNRSLRSEGGVPIVTMIRV